MDTRPASSIVLHKHARAIVCAVLLACAAGLVIAANALAIGPPPLNISAASAGNLANGPSGHPAVSGDNRKIKLVAFHSDASNLVGGDTNNLRDVFVWHRPSGSAGRTLSRVGIGRLERVSGSGRSGQANGMSEAPSVDGSMKSSAHCVAFRSRATNLSRHDRSSDWDVYVRDLRRKRTTLVSRGSRGQAGAPSISGNCKYVLFESAGRIYRASVRSGTARAIGRGTAPRYSLDGKSMTWVHRGRVVFRHKGLNRTLGRGSNPQVSDESGTSGWGVGYQAGTAVKLTTIRRSGSKRTTTVVRDALLGGITAYVAHRGIIVYSRANTLYYLNRNSGNSDTLAIGGSTITQMSSSARANLIAFATTGSSRLDGPVDQQNIYVKYLPR